MMSPPGRVATRALAAAAFAALVAAGCYDVPRPQCGFRCGPAGECPEGYVCGAADGRCHLESAPADLVCGSNGSNGPDASPAIDAAVDAM